MVDILISGGTVVTMGPERRIIKNGSVVIEGKTIVEVGKAESLKRKYKADREIEAKGRLVLPGFINVHHHTQSSTTLGRGYHMENPGTLYTMNMPMKELTPDEDRYYLGMAAILADLRMGVTFDADQDFREENIARAMADTGMRARLCEYLHSVDFQKTMREGRKVFDAEVEESTLKRGLKFINDWDGKADGRITCDLAPHATDTCTPELLERVREYADKRGKMITIHLAQIPEEVEEIKKRYGKTPVEYLKDTGTLGPDCYAAHCIYVTDNDIKILAETGTKICHCALGMSLAGGTAPLIPWLEAGITVGLGLDDRPDMIRYMQATLTVAAYRKTVHAQGYRPSAQKVLELATIEGAKVLGLEKEIGSLEPGKKADIILVDMRKPHLTPSIDPVANLVYLANGNDVETVVIDGRIVVEGGKIQTVDEMEMLRRAQEAGERAFERIYKKR